MGMRYIIRRVKPEDLSELEPLLGNLEKRLGAAAINLRRQLKVHHTPLRTTTYSFMTRQTESGFIWVCPSLELTAESEKGLRELANKYNVRDFPHLEV